MPAKVLGAFDKYAKFRIIKDKAQKYDFQRSGRESIDKKTVEMTWEIFDRQKNKKGK